MSEYEEEDSNEALDMIEEDLAYNAELIQHETFRPVSILDRGGLEINEDDFIYDQDNLRATFNPVDGYDMRGTEAQRQYQFGSFAENNGSILQNPSMIDVEGMEQYSPDERVRESMYRQSTANKNKISFAIRDTQAKDKERL